MESLNFDGNYVQESNNSQSQGKYFEHHTVKHTPRQSNHNLFVQKKNFNEPSLPEHIDKNTVFGIKTKSKFGISDVIFPNKLSEGSVVNSENFSEFYKISHHVYETGEQLNRKYQAHFDPDYRYGKRLKWLPAGAWFKNNVEQISPAQNKNGKTDYKSKFSESSEEHGLCNRYPYVDNRQGKFLGRSYLRAGDIISGKEPDEKEMEIIDYLMVVNKIKLITKKKKYNIKELRDKFRSLDQELTGWLPLDTVYEICNQHQIRPEKLMFDLALKSIHAIDDRNVRYDLFVDLIDPNIQFSVNFGRDTDSVVDRFVPTYKIDYENKFDRSVQSNKNIDDDASSYRPVKPLVLAHLDCFGSETDVKTLLSPTIYSNYGLNYRDFYMGRSKDVMENLFKNAEMDLPLDIFNIIWNNAYQRDGFDDQVSVEAFIRALREYLSNNMTDHHDQIDQ